MNVRSPAESVPVMSEARVSIVGAVLVAIGPVSMSLFTPSMPALVTAFGTTELMVKLTLSLYFAGFALAQLVCGPLSDGLGRKPVTFGFMLVYLVASVAAMFAPTIHVLIAARFVQGIGAAVGIATSRALVRDLFTSERSARIMNLMSLIMGVAPAFAPTFGGVLMALFGWKSIFIFMAVAAVVISLIIRFAMEETIVPDPNRIRPKVMLENYWQILSSRYFVFSGLAIGGSVGAIYTQATVLPFVMMTRVGETAEQFGVSMLMQSGGYLLGSLIVHRLMARYGAFRIVPAGLCGVLVGSIALTVGLRLHEPTFALVMVPVFVYAFGIAFVMPAMQTAGVAPFPHMAGSASAMAGFIQMGSGLVGGLLAAELGDPVVAMSTIVPLMGAVAIASWLVWRTLPEPALARVVVAREQRPA